MAYDTYLEERINRVFEVKKTPYNSKKMMGGLCYMVDDKMCIGIVKDHLMCRVGPDVYEKCLTKKGCKPMDFTGRPMNGYVFIAPDALDMDAELDYWIQLCIDYNPKAKSSKKK